MATLWKLVTEHLEMVLFSLYLGALLQFMLVLLK